MCARLVVRIIDATNEVICAVATLHQGMPGQMTWLEDLPPWLKPWLRNIALLR